MINREIRGNLLLWTIIVFLYVSFFLPIGSIIPTLALLAYCIFKDRFVFRLNFLSPYNLYLICFVVFCYASSLWATDTANVFYQTSHLIKIVFGMIILFLCVNERCSIDFLLKAMMWGGYFLLLYEVVFYGVNGIISMIAASERLTNEIMNANNFAMCIAYSCVIHIYYGVKEKWNFTHLLIVPSLLLLAVSGSRKGILVLVVGVIGVLVLENYKKGKSVLPLIKTLLIITCVIVGTYWILQLSFFEILRDRVFSFFSLVSGGNDVDNSLIARSRFIERGIEVFRAHPILGVGLDNAKIYNYRYVYLHNNFVEMLADGGIVGFAIYYSFYVYLIIEFIKYRKSKEKNYCICLVLFLAYLFVHYAHVAYKESGEFFMLLICYLEIDKCKVEDISDIISE